MPKGTVIIVRSPFDSARAFSNEAPAVSSYPNIFSERIPTRGAANDENEPSNARSNAYIMVWCLIGTTSANMGAFTAVPFQLIVKPIRKRVTPKMRRLSTDCGMSRRRSNENGMPILALN